MAAVPVTEVDIEDDDSAFDEELFSSSATNIECEACGDMTDFNEDIVLMQVCCPILQQGRINFYPFLDNEDNPVYPPVHLHMGCYESLSDELHLIIRDIPPLREADEPFHCDFCNSSVRIGEILVGVDVGEIGLSKKRNNPIFIPATGNETMAMCLTCAVRLAIEDTGIEIWEGLGQAEECPICTIDRCWRRGVGGCRCNCHHERRE